MNFDEILNSRQPIDEKCIGCKKTEVIGENTLCKAYIEPSLRWRLGNCALASHNIIDEDSKSKKKKLNPIKKSKRG